jgi:Flp pilus assembly protein TadD
MAIEHHSDKNDESSVMPEVVAAHGCGGGRLIAIRACLWAVSPFLKFGLAALLVAMGAGLCGIVKAAGGTQAPRAQADLTDPSVVPEQLRPLPMYSTKPGLNIDIPANGTIYPPDLIPPQFAWRDDNSRAKVWRVEMVFAEPTKPITVWSDGDKMQLGQQDESLKGYIPPTLTPEQAAAHTWRPDAKTWEDIKKHSVSAPATVIVSGFASRKDKEPLSQAQATIQTSKDPVGAPLFFRDVPLIPPPPESQQRGVIKPLPDSALPKVKWQLRYVNESQSRTMMTGLPICGNCHSFSGDGKTLGIDVDGPANDKGFYALVPLKKVSTISDEQLIHWFPYSEEHSQKRLGFMSQVSPDGQYVVNSIVPRTKGQPVPERLYNGFFWFYGFNQVFYPTRGVLAWYSKETDKLQPLPGADDPNFVQTSAFWSPDGKYLIFSRAASGDPYPPGYKRSMYAGDPNETQIKYDLYKIPFNGGKGGTAERVIGASGNGMSNNFPKVSPDGKWIVFVECKNGLLMRPDSKLYIVPFEGGEARPLESNLPVMNSWHTFSPNGKWLAFSSKSPSFYTQLYLTHIDDQGHASPPVLVENATASNRAANIPEFVNIGPDGLDHIETPAVDFYREFDQAQQLQDEKLYDEAIPAWRIAIAKHPTDARPHNLMGVALAATGNTSEAIAEYKKSLELNPDSSRTHNNLGSALAQEGRFDEAMVQIGKAIELNPDGSVEHINMGHLLDATGHPQEAIEELKKGLELAPKNSDARNTYGVILAREGKLDEAIGQLQQAVELAPRSSECRFNLGRTLSASGRFQEALPQFDAAASLTKNEDPAILQMLAATYAETGHYQQAVVTAQQALDVAVEQRKVDLATALRGDVARYESRLRQASGSGAAQP